MCSVSAINALLRVVHLYYNTEVAVDWSHRAEYIWVKHGVTADQADEALADPDRVVIDPDYNSRSGASVRTIGYAPSRAALMSVITVEEDGAVFGINAWKSNEKDQGIYRERNATDEQEQA